MHAGTACMQYIQIQAVHVVIKKEIQAVHNAVGADDEEVDWELRT